MPNPRAQRPLSLQAVTEDIRSLAQPAEALLDMLAGAAKGSVTATAGIGGDLESLAQGLAAAYRAPSGQRMDAFAGGLDQPTVLPTTKNISDKLPAVVPTTAPLSRQHTAEYGQGMGEFIPTPGSGKVVKGGLSMAGQALNDRLLAGQSLTPGFKTPAPIMHLDVWHGSPHKFPPTKRNPLGEFDPAKIGTGEGAQQYGIGHYTAEAKDVAKSYQPRSPEYEQKLLNLYNKAQSSSNYPMMEVLEDAMLHQDPEDILKKFTNMEDGYTPAHAKAAQDFSRWHEKNPPEVGSLYRVDLSDEAIAKMLDYDKPINEQATEVLEMLERAGINTKSSAKAGTMIHGQEEYLAKHGIPGIKYLDEGSRGAGEGTRNFVVFPGQEDVMTILDRKKEGGSVHISDNPDAQMMAVEEQKFGVGGAAVRRVLGIKDHAERAVMAQNLLVKMAKEGQVDPDMQRALLKAQSGPRALPTVLPRAKPKTKEEIREYAQRTAEQMNAAQAGEFLRADPNGPSINAAGKSKSQWDMEQGLKHDIRPLGLPLDPIQVSNIEDQLGMLKMGITGDTSISDQVLHRAGMYNLPRPSEQQGGPLYGLRKRNIPMSWASNVPVLENVAKDVNEFSRAYGNVPVIGQYNSMGPQGTNFAQHFADANLEAIDITKMTPEQVEKTNDLIRKGNEKSGPVPDFPGIEDPSGAYFFFSFYPELRKHFNAIMTKPDYTKALGLPDGRVILHAITEPELRDMPVLTSGKAQYQLVPGQDPNQLPLSSHSTYTHDLPRDPKAPVMRTPYPVPAEFEFSDVVEYAKPRYKPQEMTRVLQTAAPRQIIDQQHIDEIKMYEEMMKHYTGKKKGGQIKKAEGGEITADDLILEERKL